MIKRLFGTIAKGTFLCCYYVYVRCMFVCLFNLFVVFSLTLFFSFFIHLQSVCISIYVRKRSFVTNESYYENTVNNLLTINVNLRLLLSLSFSFFINETLSIVGYIKYFNLKAFFLGYEQDQISFSHIVWHTIS